MLVKTTLNESIRQPINNAANLLLNTRIWKPTQTRTTDQNWTKGAL